ncbi:MAG TPA: hypothetical protein PKG60_14465 [Spirochaetota bacterium]|nr:hypothetical protein [Spirochaetota bacterium]HPS85431.1 hypothetical protein [Spirochaetota bacterium]
MKFLFRLNILILLILNIIIPRYSFAQGKQTVVIDTPTAFTIAKGTYKLSFLEYDNGGMELKTFLGLHDIFYLGVSVDVQSAIGRDDPKFNVPGVIGKVKFNDGWEVFPIVLAAGYDSFYVGYDGVEENTDNELNRVIYGPYFVLTGSIYLLDSEQFLSAGIRTPTQPYYKPENTSYFASLDIPLGEFFRFQVEMERVYWNFRDNDEWLYNVGLKYNYFDHVGFEIAVIMQDDQKPNRIIRIEYHGEF